jgi:hypothetical protein
MAGEWSVRAEAQRRFEEWARDRHCDVETLIAAGIRAGIAHAAEVCGARASAYATASVYRADSRAEVALDEAVACVRAIRDLLTNPPPPAGQREGETE